MVTKLKGNNVVRNILTVEVFDPQLLALIKTHTHSHPLYLLTAPD